MTIGSDEITMGNLNLFMVLAIAFIAMLLLYQLISKTILYNISNGEKIFLFQNAYAYIGLNKFELLYHLLLAFPLQNIFINNIFILQATEIQVFSHIIMVCTLMYSLTYVQKGYVVNDLVIIWY